MKNARAAGKVPADAICAFPLLASASAVSRYCLPDGCGELPHVTRRIDAFLDVLSPTWTFAESYKRTGSLGLLQYLAARESKASVGVDQFYRRWLFNEATELAAERGDLDALRLLMERDLPNEFLTKAVAAAASKGHLHILEWLYEEHHDRGYWGCTEMCGAMKNHHDDVVAWLRIHAVPRGDSAPEVLQAAASAGYLDVVQWLHRERRVSATGALDCAMSGKQWETVRWLLENIDKKCRSLDWTGAIDDGALAFLKLLLSRKIRNCGHGIIASAAAYGHLEIIKWSHCELHVPLRGVEAMRWAAKRGDVTMLKWLDAAGYKDCDHSVMDSAADQGHLEVVQWLHTHRAEGCSAAAMDWAARNGHLEVVKWLHANRTEGCSPDAMDGAARNGVLDVVEWLNEHRNEGCTTAAMDGAAEKGATTQTMDWAAWNAHLDVVKWLHENREEGCTSSAMDIAARNGHLEMVKWLYANREERCTVDAMDNAAANGHLEIVKWLHSIRAEGCTSKAMREAILGGHFDVVLLLHLQRWEGFSFQGCMVVNTCLELTQWLFQNCTDNMVGVPFSASTSHWRFSEWCRQLNLRPRQHGFDTWWELEILAPRWRERHLPQYIGAYRQVYNKLRIRKSLQHHLESIRADITDLNRPAEPRIAKSGGRASQYFRER